MRRRVLSAISMMLVVPAIVGCQSMERPDVFVVGITPMESTIFEQRLRIDLRFLNPNDSEIAVRGLDFKLDINDARLARGVSGEGFALPALGEARTSVTASTTFLDLLRQLPTLADQDRLTYRLRGRLHLEQGWPGTLSFDQTDTLAELPPAPDPVGASVPY
jgi:LEA14-like dessication related protein